MALVVYQVSNSCVFVDGDPPGLISLGILGRLARSGSRRLLLLGDTLA